MQVSLGNYNTKQYCDNIDLSSLSPVQRQGGYHQFSIPITSFKCSFAQSSITQVGFQNVEGQAASFCLDDIQIVGASSGGSSSSQAAISSGGR